MQLTAKSTRPSRSHLPNLVAVAALVAAIGQVQPARGADSSDTDQPSSSRDEDSAKHKKGDDKKDKADKRDKADKAQLEDTATKRVGIEFAGYNDSDHIAVVHALDQRRHRERERRDAQRDRTSSTSCPPRRRTSSRPPRAAGRRSARPAGSPGSTSRTTSASASAASVSSEPDYLSYGFFATIVKDFDEKNWTLDAGYGFSHDTAGRCGVGGGCTPFSVFSRDLQRGSFNAGISLGRRSLVARLAHGRPHPRERRPVQGLPLHPDVLAQRRRPACPNGASIDYVNANRLPERPLEQLPLERRRFALTGRYAHRFDGVHPAPRGALLRRRLGPRRLDDRRSLDLRPRQALRPLAARPLPRAEGAASFWQRAYVSDNPNGDPRRLGPAPLPHGRPRARPHLDDRGRLRLQVVPGQRRRAAHVAARVLRQTRCTRRSSTTST